MKKVFELYAILFLCANLAATYSVSAETPTLEIGWQTTWATQGQLAMILQKTDILKKHGLKANFQGFSYGGPLNEAALAGKVNVVFTADQPALTLMSRSEDWVIASRLMYNSGALLVHPKSEIKSVSELKGKSVAVPFVAAVHRVLVDLENNANLTPGTDVKNVNLGVNEVISIAESGKDKGWGEISAIMIWDPTPLLLEAKDLARPIARGNIVAVTLLQKELAKDKGLVDAFRASLEEAYSYYKNNRETANSWFAEAARIDYDPSILDKAASMEPNLTNDKPDVRLSMKDTETLQGVEEFLLRENLIKSPVGVEKRILR